jgi:predicted flap endonuclease-1-like 5' DNA nuclease
MAELLQENWILLIVALIVALLVTFWLFAASRRTRVEIEQPDRRDAPPRRNQALIDSPPASGVSGLALQTPPGLGGAGEAVAATIVPQVLPSEPVPATLTAEAAATPDSGSDDLTRIKGLGPKLAEQLRQLGITRLDQIAAWDDAEIDRIDAQLGRFQGRIRRDDWPGQARLLAQGDTVGYEAKFGKI